MKRLHSLFRHVKPGHVTMTITWLFSAVVYMVIVGMNLREVILTKAIMAVRIPLGGWYEYQRDRLIARFVEEPATVRGQAHIIAIGAVSYSAFVTALHSVVAVVQYFYDPTNALEQTARLLGFSVISGLLAGGPTGIVIDLTKRVYAWAKTSGVTPLNAPHKALLALAALLGRDVQRS